MADREPSPEPVTDYVRFRIEGWIAAGRKLKDLAALGGFAAPSMVSQVKLKTSAVTNFTGPKFAQAFGFADYPDLVQAAYGWAKGGPAEPGRSGHLAEGIRRALEYHVTQPQIDRVIASVGDRGDHLDALAWLSLFHAERTLDLKVDGELLAAGRAAAATARTTTKKHDEMRAATGARDAAAAAHRAKARKERSKSPKKTA